MFAGLTKFYIHYVQAIYFKHSEQPKNIMVIMENNEKNKALTEVNIGLITQLTPL